MNVESGFGRMQRMQRMLTCTYASWGCRRGFFRRGFWFWRGTGAECSGRPSWTEARGARGARGAQAPGAPPASISLATCRRPLDVRFKFNGRTRPKRDPMRAYRATLVTTINFVSLDLIFESRFRISKRSFNITKFKNSIINYHVFVIFIKWMIAGMCVYLLWK